MNSNWNKYTIRDITEINSESLKKGHNLTIIEYLDTSSVTENNFTNTEILDIQKAPSRAKRIVRDKDIIISTVRPNLKHYGFIKNPKDNLIVSTGFAVIKCKFEIVEPKYLYYFLSLTSTTKYLTTIADGSTSTYPSIKPSVIADMSIILPSLPTQKKIAHILSTLDDKIELNRKMNQTLEEMAQALFKSWFVDFDPVRAKANCSSDEELEVVAKELGISKEILELFPSEFEDSELGMIPKGWRVKQLSEIDLEIESGRRPKGGIDKELKLGIPSVGAESITSIGIFDFSKTKYVSESFASNAKKGWVQNMDVALYKDGGKPGLFIPRVSLYGNNYPFINFMINEHVFLLRSELLGQPYLYNLISSKNVLDQLISKGSSKAAQPGLNQTEVKDTKFILPNDKLLNIFNIQVKSFITKQLSNGKEIQILQKTRNTLLPKLLSGELEV
jgi:type I restriction enzyme S subunit